MYVYIYIYIYYTQYMILYTYIYIYVEGDHNSGFNTLTPRCCCWRRPDEARGMLVVCLGGRKRFQQPEDDSSRMSNFIHRDSGFHHRNDEDLETERPFLLSLLQAFAKMLGSYTALSGGNCCSVLRHMGAATFGYPFSHSD